MSYGFYRLGSNVPGKVMPTLGYTFNGDVLLKEPEHVDTMPPSASMPHVDTLLVAQPGMGRMEARASGYTGDQCSHCNSMRMKIAGHCLVCESCGTTTGCS